MRIPRSKKILLSSLESTESCTEIDMGRACCLDTLSTIFPKNPQVEAAPIFGKQAVRTNIKQRVKQRVLVVSVFVVERRGLSAENDYKYRRGMNTRPC